MHARTMKRIWLRRGEVRVERDSLLLAGVGISDRQVQDQGDAKGAAREGMVGKLFDARGEKILQALAAVSRETGATQASVALAWLLAQPNLARPIASATSTRQLESLFAAAELKLSSEQIKTLTEASSY